MSTDDEPSDAELLRRYNHESTDDDGEPFMAIYMRYRDVVRSELEAAGLSPVDAETRAGAVFIQTLNDRRNVMASRCVRDCVGSLARSARISTGDPYERQSTRLTDGKGACRIPLGLGAHVFHAPGGERSESYGRVR
jgi:hypothetical protein